MFVKPDRTFDLPKLKEITKVITRNLNRIIDVNFYPVPEVSRIFLIQYNYSSIYFEFFFFLRLNDPTSAIVRSVSEFKVWLMLSS